MGGDDAWAAMDAWCKKRAEDLRDQSAIVLKRNGYKTDDPAHRVLLGQSQAYHAMRSFIHGARPRPNHTPPAKP